MPQLNLLIKPASSLCNMRCDYCFYRDVADHRQQPSYGIMSPEVTEAMVKNVFLHGDSSVSFTFQGGEPTLAGTAYFERFHDLVDTYNNSGVQNRPTKRTRKLTWRQMSATSRHRSEKSCAGTGIWNRRDQLMVKRSESRVFDFLQVLDDE